MTGAPPLLSPCSTFLVVNFYSQGETSRAQIKGNGPNIYHRIGSGTHLRNGYVKYFLIKSNTKKDITYNIVSLTR